MLVDDEKDIVYVLHRGLQLKGFEVDSFIDPKQAAEKFKPELYDVVVTDINMPQMDGFELYHKIREKDPHVKIYFLCAFDAYEREVREKFPNSALTGFIRKPITYGSLIDHLMKHEAYR